MMRPFLRLITLTVLLVLILPTGSLAAGQGPRVASPLANATGDIVINEVMFAPASGGYEWVELKNSGSSPVAIKGFGLTDEDGNWYYTPATLPPMPADAFVVVVFDGQGSAADDLSFDDNVATLHSQAGLTSIFEDAADQCALYQAGAVAPAHQLYLPLILQGSSAANSALTASDSPDSGPTSVADDPSIMSFVA